MCHMDLFEAADVGGFVFFVVCAVECCAWDHGSMPLLSADYPFENICIAQLFEEGKESDCCWETSYPFHLTEEEYVYNVWNKVP